MYSALYITNDRREIFCGHECRIVILNSIGWVNKDIGFDRYWVFIPIPILGTDIGMVIGIGMSISILV